MTRPIRATRIGESVPSINADSHVTVPTGVVPCRAAAEFQVTSPTAEARPDTDGAVATRPGATYRSSASREPGAKLAATVADRIVTDIADAGWPVGEVIGSEAQLLERYGVSRAVFREAARVVELQQVARMRRGPGGGLVVSPPSLDSVTDAVSVYLYFVGAAVDDVFEARIALESGAAEMAPERMQESDIARLRELVQREHDEPYSDYRELHRLVAAAAGNPALEFFVELLNRMTFLYLPPRTKMTTDTLSASQHAHAAIADAIMSGNGGLAAARMRKHLAAEADFLRRRRRSPSELVAIPAIGRSNKLPEVTARAIFQSVVEAGWPVGDLLGSESTLMDEYGVSRAVFREAVRLLEHFGVARMRRGPGGGLFVTAPGIGATTDAIALHVARSGITPAQLFEVRAAVEMVVLDRVMETPNDETARLLREALEIERTVSRPEFAVVGHDLHPVLAHASGNKVLHLITLVLTQLTRLRSSAPEGVSDPLPTRAVIDVHEGIVTAIVDGDVDLARYRMRRHLDALVNWVS